MTDRPAPPDPTRRRFFRQVAGDVLSSVGSVVGAAQVLQQQSAEAARDLLAPEAVTAPGTAVEVDASTAGWRAAMRWDGDVCRVVDQRRLPDVLADLEVRGSADAITAINDGAIVGGAVQAQLAAVTLALVAGRARASRAFARRATIRGSANAFRTTRPGSAAVGQALERMLALLETFDAETPGATVEAAFRAEAEAIIAEASADHGALVEHAVAALPGAPDEPLTILTAGSTGAMGGGQFGTAISALIAAHHAGRPVHALVSETRPGLEGARIATWELAQAGVPHALVTDAAAPSCIADGGVAAVLVGADRVCANGDVIATAGTYPLALAAHAAGIPFLVLVATSAVDLGAAGADGVRIEDGRPGPVLTAGGTRVAPEGTPIRNPRQDVTPAVLLTGIVTEAGVARQPFEPALAEHVASAEARRSASPGFAALVAARVAAAAQPTGEGTPALAAPTAPAATEASAATEIVT